MKKVLYALLIIGLVVSSAMYIRQVQEEAGISGREIRDEDFYAILEEEELFYVYFYTPTCDQCQSAEPKLLAAMEQVPVLLYRIDTQDNPGVFASYQKELELPGVPVMLRFEKGKVTGGRAGAPESADIYIQFFSEKTEQP